MSVLMSIFLGIVQGLSEFLPISSSGHLSIFQNLFGLQYDEGDHLLFDVLLHLATLASVCVVYRRELKEMIADTMDLILGRTAAGDSSGRLKPTVRSVLLIVVATLPLILVVPFHSKIETLYYNTPFIAFALIITGMLLFVSGKFAEGRKNERTATVMDAFVVGLAQAVATIPGLSRSGTTITVGMSRGYRTDYAVRFSFLMSIPAVLGSTIISLFSAVKNGIVWGNVPVYLIGMIFAGVVGYFALSFIKRFITKQPLTYFAYYCWGMGILALILSLVLKK